ncbi:glycine cleavage system protein GcvH [Leptolinea tardivitalis]|uniref:Glycine cleavage system H protein n=1 Tax=Leptolinea tardivitalis TaxID=229920 RepID=A0A0P6XB24_9CHLR|nr:glycine cleavage system protein GcvH [Leptolinea tardivitalis]KPL72417.1 glycine cleavage system protein H [Leptolinea tardivitalis]GAP22744.1 glycine cleavage system H protein [Leptolinea tardivitalis]
MNVPADYKYTASDEWVKLDGKIATIGVSDYAQEQLSDVVFVEVVLGEGDSAKKGTTCATIESVKAAADVNLPVSGKVIQVNEDLSKTPELVNTDPYGKAWMLKVEISDPSEINGLMSSADYEKFLQDRSH